MLDVRNGAGAKDWQRCLIWLFRNGMAFRSRLSALRLEEFLLASEPNVRMGCRGADGKAGPDPAGGRVSLSRVDCCLYAAGPQGAGGQRK